MKTNEKVISLSAAKKLRYFDDLNIREAEQARLTHMRKLQKNPPSPDLLALASSLSTTDAFEKEFEILKPQSSNDAKSK